MDELIKVHAPPQSTLPRARHQFNRRLRSGRTTLRHDVIEIGFHRLPYWVMLSRQQTTFHRVQSRTPPVLDLALVSLLLTDTITFVIHNPRCLR